MSPSLYSSAYMVFIFLFSFSLCNSHSFVFMDFLLGWILPSMILNPLGKILIPVLTMPILFLQVVRRHLNSSLIEQEAFHGPDFLSSIPFISCLIPHQNPCLLSLTGYSDLTSTFSSTALSNWGLTILLMSFHFLAWEFPFLFFFF